ncbi:MAG: glycosyltransferase family 4 protein [Anaerolineales bacterium]|nr:glycosyltransferase family 4 protein [Anaerolineales bacterium]
MRIGQVSFRLAGSDGVSLETAKQTRILAELGFSSCYFAGELDPPNAAESQLKANITGSRLVPEAHFTHPEVVWITNHAFGTTVRHPGFDQRLQALSLVIEKALLDFIKDFRIDVLVAQNILAIPLNLALSSAFFEVIRKTGIPAIAHHHDFYWEREKYRTNCVDGLLQQLFPPDLPNLRHMVINSMAQQKLLQMGFESVVLPNVLDFNTPSPGVDNYNRDLREEIGLNEDDLFFLQPTRVVPRKGIELAVELVSKLGDPRIKLIISHSAEYNTIDYLEDLCALAARAHVPLVYLPARFKPVRGTGPHGEKIYSLWDAYLFSDFVTYPSLYEGFGNALLEAVYFKKPFLVNRYQVFEQDIEPTGIKAVKMDGEVTETVVNEVKSLLGDRNKQILYAEVNTRIAQEHFSFKTAAAKLERILNSF